MDNDRFRNYALPLLKAKRFSDVTDEQIAALEVTDEVRARVIKTVKNAKHLKELQDARATARAPKTHAAKPVKPVARPTVVEPAPAEREETPQDDVKQRLLNEFAFYTVQISKIRGMTDPSGQLFANAILLLKEVEEKQAAVAVKLAEYECARSCASASDAPAEQPRSVEPAPKRDDEEDKISKEKKKRSEESIERKRASDRASKQRAKERKLAEAKAAAEAEAQAAAAAKAKADAMTTVSAAAPAPMEDVPADRPAVPEVSTDAPDTDETQIDAPAPLFGEDLRVAPELQNSQPLDLPIENADVVGARSPSEFLAHLSQRPLVGSSQEEYAEQYSYWYLERLTKPAPAAAAATAPAEVVNVPTVEQSTAEVAPVVTKEQPTDEEQREVEPPASKRRATRSSMRRAH